jgi:pimeloyl-ACP methyl ester carboxylesterase
MQAIFLALFLSAISVADTTVCELQYAKLAPLSGVKKAQDLIQFADGRRVVYRTSKVENPKGTVLLLNGLMVRMKDWDSYIQRLNAAGYNVTQMIFSGQPESMLEASKNGLPAFAKKPITPAMLTEEVGAVLKAAPSDGPLHIQTYSFGAMAGIHYANKNPKDVASITMITPLVQSLDHYIPQVQQANAAFQGMQASAALFDPFGMFGMRQSLEEMKTQAYRKSVNDSLLKYEPGKGYVAGLDPESFRAGVTELSMGARDFDLRTFSNKDLPKVNLVLVGNEFYEPMKKEQIEFWNALPPRSKGTIVEYDAFGHNDILGDAEAATDATTQYLLDPQTPAGQFLKLETKSGKLIPLIVRR